jgi:hypothetical protein
MPEGGMNTVEIAVCSIPALLAMKGFALQKRYKQKDAYDIYYCIRNYPGGIDELAMDCRPILELPSGAEGYGYIAAKFDSPDGFGATCVNGSRMPSDRSTLGYGLCRCGCRRNGGRKSARIHCCSLYRPALRTQVSWITLTARGF